MPSGHVVLWRQQVSFEKDIREGEKEMKFAYTQKREWKSASQRSVLMGTHGMVASSQPLATLAGYKMLLKGGNAVDAAVAMVSVLSVVEPHSVGLGGDAFALIYFLMFLAFAWKIQRIFPLPWFRALKIWN